MRLHWHQRLVWWTVNVTGLDGDSVMNILFLTKFQLVNCKQTENLATFNAKMLKHMDMKKKKKTVGSKIYRHNNIMKSLPRTNHGNDGQCLYGRNYLTIKKVPNMMQLALAVQQETMEKLCMNLLSYEKDITNMAYNVASYLLTPWRTVLEKLTGFQLVKKFPIFYGTLRFITTLTSACHLSLP